MNYKIKVIAGLAGWLTLVLVSINTGISGQSPRQMPPGPRRTAVPADSVDKETGLRVAPGYMLVKANCLTCHSPQLITGKRATRDGWLATIRWMQQNQGLWDLGKAEPEILNYLAEHYAPTNEGRRPPLKNIEWYKL